MSTTLNIVVEKELSTANAPTLTQELSKYEGQNIRKNVFDASQLLYLSSAGIRVIFYANQKLGCDPEIVFLNCANEIYEVLNHVGLTSSIKFEKNVTKRIIHKQKELDSYAANNDVVCYNMKMGQVEE